LVDIAIDFSIIVPTFNRPQNLARLLSAFDKLEYAHDRYQVIIVDDGSETNLDPVIAPFQQTMNVVLHKQTNAGPAAARNYGVQFALGQFLAFTDDDCIPAPHWLLQLYQHLTKLPNCMVGGKIANALVDNVYSSASQLITDLVYAYYNADPWHARFAATNNLAMPTDLFRALGGFDPTFRTSEDRDWCDRWLKAGYPFIYADDAVIYHAHQLTFALYWRQHVGYGRGAWRFNRAHARRSANSTIQSDFYLTSLRRLQTWLPQLPKRRAVGLAGLLILWQVANTIGFASQMLQLPSRNVFSKRY
jgi:GT2 family glycosyltransferase